MVGGARSRAFTLTAPLETLTIAGKRVHSVQSGDLLVRLERVLSLELIRARPDRKPQPIVCLDEGSKDNDYLKAIAAQPFKTKSVSKFQTV